MQIVEATLHEWRSIIDDLLEEEKGRFKLIKFDMPGLMENLSDKRPIFHSEKDFQNSLASYLHEAMPKDDSYREFHPFPSEGMRLDIWLSGVGVAIELKYRSKKLGLEWENESFTLSDHGAQDHGRYDFLNDIQRLERVVADFRPAKAGYAVLLTNDPSFWHPPGSTKKTPNDAAFRLHEGRKITGEMVWSPKAGEGTKKAGKNREDPIRLKSSYDCAWREYSSFGEATNQRFRYLMVEVLLAAK